MSAREPLVVYVRINDGPVSGDGHAVDPVCGRELVPGMAHGKVIHAGIEYLFCSLSCARTFATRPSEFLA
jgi:YHS domain-containing protein